MDAQVKKYWAEFLERTNRSQETACFEVFYFDSSEQAANQLLALVLAGKKTATASLVDEYEVIPQVGDVSIVTDYQGNPACIIETTDVQRMKFHEMTEDICQREGEDDTLASWQKSHRAFFTERSKHLSTTFSDDSELLFEDFVVIYQ